MKPQGDAVLQHPISCHTLQAASTNKIIQDTPDQSSPGTPLPLTFGVEPLLWKWVPRALSVGVLCLE